MNDRIPTPNQAEISPKEVSLRLKAIALENGIGLDLLQGTEKTTLIAHHVWPRALVIAILEGVENKFDDFCAGKILAELNKFIPGAISSTALNNPSIFTKHKNYYNYCAHLKDAWPQLSAKAKDALLNLASEVVAKSSTLQELRNRQNYAN